MSTENRVPVGEGKGKRAAANAFGWLLTAVCFGLIGWFAHSWMPKGRAGGGGREAPAAPSVTAVEAKSLPYDPEESYVAHVEAVKEVDILPQIDGYITAVKFEEGSAVKAGDVLFEIDPERYAAMLDLRRSELAKAEAAVTQAGAEVARAEAEVDRAQRYYARMQKADKRGITQSDLDTAETSLAAARAGLAQAKSGVTQARAGVMQAKANIALAEFDTKHTKVFAPITGQIGKTLVHAGDYVSPAKGPMARIVQTDPIRVAFPLTDRAYVTWRQELASRDEGEPMNNRILSLILPNGTKYREDGKWAFDDNEMSPETATMMVRLSFRNPRRILIPNTFVTLQTRMTRPPCYPTVPETALMDVPGGRGVWVLRPDGTAEQRPVEVVGTVKGQAAVRAGLKPGERVVDEGCHKVRPGLRLDVRPSARAAAAAAAEGKAPAAAEGKAPAA